MLFFLYLYGIIHMEKFMDKIIKSSDDVKYINYVQTSPESTKYEK